MTLEPLAEVAGGSFPFNLKAGRVLEPLVIVKTARIEMEKPPLYISPIVFHIVIPIGDSFANPKRDGSHKGVDLAA